MTTWAAQVDGHPVRAELDAAIKLAGDLDEVPESHQDAVRRVREVLVHARDRIRTADPYHVSVAQLNTVSAQVATIATPLQHFQANPAQPAYLDQVLPPADALLITLAAIPVAPPDKTTREASERAKELRTVANDGARAVRAELEALRTKLVEAQESFATAGADAGSEVEKLRTMVGQLSATVEQQSGRLDTALTDFDTRTQSALADLQTTFQTAETARAEQVQAEAKSKLEELGTAWTGSREEFEEEGRSVVIRLGELRDQAEGLVGTITSTGTAGYFKKVADGEKTAADTWRIITVAAAAAVGLIGLWAVLTSDGGASSDWETLLAKLFLSSPFAAISAYAGRQSGSHRRAERDARHRELQLAALEPFLLPLGDEEKAAVRAGFAQHLFGPPTQEVNGEAADAISNPELIRALAAAVVQNGAKR